MNKVKQNSIIVTSEFPPQPGGIGNHAYNLALHLSKNNYDVIVIADQRSLDGKEENQFDNALPFKVIRVKRYSFRFRMYIKRIVITFKYLKQASHIFATGKFSLWNVAFCSLFYNRNSIAVVHGSEVNFKSYFLKSSIDIALNRFKKIIAVSNFTKGLISDIKSDVVVIPNGIDLSKWEITDSSRADLKGNPVLTTVGRVSERKGQLNIIKQLPKLIKQFPDLHYHCIGIATEANGFIKIAEELGVLPHITFHGSVNHSTLKQMLNETDVFVMLSTESKTGDVEGFGIAILEANALGVPAIGAKGCGIEDAIQPYVSGILIKSKNENEFIDAINQILQNKSKFEEDAKIWAKSHDWTQIVKRYIDVME